MAFKWFRVFLDSETQLLLAHQLSITWQLRAESRRKSKREQLPSCPCLYMSLPAMSLLAWITTSLLHFPESSLTPSPV
ncbi:hypothetical protein I79_014864 [Cricetulus griseus]|uniref:Uncharacterized protein n=1 Tax=Cricetulus griseus TaxID=10029 RepID=G3HV86_CRIGR|nr:hypothetical protein I79_014864 [Cricetulus griseus]